MKNDRYAFLLRVAMEEGPKGDWAKQQLAMLKPQATIGPFDPYNAVSEEEILNREDPKVMERLKETYWFTLSIEEQDRRFAEVKALHDRREKAAADQNRLAGSGVGNQTVANILVGGSNMIVNAINTASFGMPGTIAEWIMGPNPEGYVDPLDDPYGKKAGQFLGTVVSIGLPFKYVKAIKTPGAVGKFSPTLLRSMVAGGVSGTVAEGFDAFNDFREDGKQSLSERIAAVGINTAIAGAGDAVITAGSKLAGSAVRLVRGKLPNLKVAKVEEAGTSRAEIEIKAREIKEPRIEGTGDFDLKEWEDMPVSGQTRLTPDGLRIMSIRDMKKFKSEMNANDIKVIIDKNGSILPEKAVGGFNPNTGQIILRPDASLLSTLHESFHAKQFRELGKEKYLKLPTLEKEEYVYNEIMKNKSKFSAEEIYEAQRYIFKLRNGQWPLPSWKGFDE